MRPYCRKVSGSSDGERDLSVLGAGPLVGAVAELCRPLCLGEVPSCHPAGVRDRIVDSGVPFVYGTAGYRRDQDRVWVRFEAGLGGRL